MPLDAPMMVRNTQPGPLVFSADGDATNYFEFGGANDPDGKDIQIVPAELKNNVHFRRNLTLGLLVVEQEQGDIETALASQKAEWDWRQSERSQNAQAALEQVSDNDILQKECVGPGTRPGEHVCGTPVPQRSDAARVHPPLCQMHKHLAGEYVAKETGRIVGQRNEVVWVKASPTK